MHNPITIYKTQTNKYCTYPVQIFSDSLTPEILGYIRYHSDGIFYTILKKNVLTFLTESFEGFPKFWNIEYY